MMGGKIAQDWIFLTKYCPFLWFVKQKTKNLIFEQNIVPFMIDGKIAQKLSFE